MDNTLAQIIHLELKDIELVAVIIEDCPVFSKRILDAFQTLFSFFAGSRDIVIGCEICRKPMAACLPCEAFKRGEKSPHG